MPMEPESLTAFGIVDIDSDRAEEWFQLVNNAYLVSKDNWNAFQDRLTTDAAHDFEVATQTFLEHVAAQGQIELIGRFVEDLGRETDPLATLHADARLEALQAEARLAALPAEARPATPQPDSLWDAVIEQFGAYWDGWDSSEDGWIQFRDRLYSAANANNPEMYVAVYDRIDPLNNLPPAKRIMKLVEFGFAIDTTAESTPGTATNATAANPAVMADKAVVTIGLPAVRNLVAVQPGLVGREELSATLAVALAHLLTAQPAPNDTALSIALAGHLEQSSAANPILAGEFYAVFDVNTRIAQQWIEQAITAHANEFPVLAPATAPVEPSGDGKAEDADEAINDLFGEAADVPASPTMPPPGTYLMPELVEQFLQDVPGAEILTPDQINDTIREVLADSQGSTE